MLAASPTNGHQLLQCLLQAAACHCMPLHEPQCCKLLRRVTGCFTLCADVECNNRAFSAVFEWFLSARLGLTQSRCTPVECCILLKGSCSVLLQVKTLQGRLSDSHSLTARLQREMLLVKAKAEALEFSVSEKDAEIELLRQRQERQDTQVKLVDGMRQQSPALCALLTS